MNELVSVIIPTYKRLNTLKRAIESVIKQTYHNIEILVIDDNADFPNIRVQVRELTESFFDQRVHLILNNKGLGGALSRNEGIFKSRGNFVAFLDDDDEYYPEKIGKQFEVFRKTNNKRLALVYCHCVMMENETKALRTYRYSFKGNCVFDGMRDCIAATSQWMCNKNALLDVGCFSDVPCKQDSNLIVKLLTKGYEIDYVPEVLSKYYRDSGNGISITSSHEKRIAGEEALRELCREHYGLLTNKEQRIVEYSFACRLMEHYYALGLKDECRKEIKKVIMHPFSRMTLGAIKRTILH